MCTNDQEMRDGLLTVRVSHESDECVVALDGEIDLANVAVVESALHEAMNNGGGRVLVDMRGLSFIDSTGIACLVRILHGDGSGRLRFLHSDAPAVLRVLRLTGVEEKLTPPDPE